MLTLQELNLMQIHQPMPLLRSVFMCIHMPWSMSGASLDIRFLSRSFISLPVTIVVLFTARRRAPRLLQTRLAQCAHCPGLYLRFGGKLHWCQHTGKLLSWVDGDREF